MSELPTCTCVRGLPPYDRLTAIYQAAAELSGDGDLPDPVCVAGIPPFSRFSYIYEAFRVFAGEDSLPSQICVAVESPQDQVSRIYQAVALYADDAELESYECVRGMPIWQQWVEIYRALYSIAGSDELTDPLCVNSTFDILSDVFCAVAAIDGGGGATLLASFYIPEIVDSFSRTIAAGYTGDGDPDTFQREAAVDVLRDAHYQSGNGPFVILEDDPTPCVLVAPANIVGVGGELEFDASWDAIPVTISLDHYEWRLDGAGGWNDNGLSTTITAGSATEGDHVLNVRSVSTSGVFGDVGNSPSFTVDPSSAVWTYSQSIPSVTDNNLSVSTTPQYQLISLPAGTVSKLSVYTSESVGGNLKIALYNSSKNLLASGSMVPPVDIAAHDLEATIPDTVISAGNYYIGYLCDADSLQNFRLAPATGTILFKFGVPYGSFPNDPIAEDGSASLSARVGALIS